MSEIFNALFSVGFFFFPFIVAKSMGMGFPVTVAYPIYSSLYKKKYFRNGTADEKQK